MGGREATPPVASAMSPLQCLCGEGGCPACWREPGSLPDKWSCPCDQPGLPRSLFFNLLTCSVMVPPSVLIQLIIRYTLLLWHS